MVVLTTQKEKKGSRTHAQITRMGTQEKSKIHDIEIFRCKVKETESRKKQGHQRDEG